MKQKVGAAAIGCVTLALAACSGGGGSRTTTVPSTAPQRAAITFPTELSSTFDDPITLAGDPNGAGVWLVAGSVKGLSVFHYDEATKVMDDIGVGSTAVSRQYTTRAGLAVDRSGMVWLGALLSLTRYDTKTGATQDFDLEALLKSVADETPLLPEKRGQRVVNSVAVTPDGSKVVVGFDGSSRLLVYATATQRWSKLELGLNTAVENVAVSDTGVVAAAVDTLFTGRNVLAVWVGDERKETLADLGPVTYRDGTFVRGPGPTLVRAADGVAVPLVVRDRPAAARVSIFFAGAGGQLIASTFTGFGVVGSDGEWIGAADFPVSACAPAALPPTTKEKGSGTTSSILQSVPCPGHVTFRVGIDARGKVWFGHHQGTVEYIGRFDPALAR